MSQLDLFLTVISTTDVKKKISIGNDIINYLQDPSNGIECEDIGSFIDGVVQWLLSSNFRVSQNGLDVLACLIDRMRDDFRPYLQIVIPPCIDRLGDTKDSVRDKANVVILKCMEFCAPPQQIFERMIPGFGHKSQKVREEVLTLLQTTLNTHSASSLSLNKIVPSVVKLLSDPAGPVREIAFATLVEIYRHVGDRFRQDLLNKQNVPPSKLPTLVAKFDEILKNGELLPTATRIDSIKAEDEPDKALTKSIAKRSTSAPPVRRNGQTPVGKALGGPSISQPCPAPPSLSGQAGAMDEALFIQCFEDVPKVQFFSAREMEDNMQAIREVIANTNNEWDKRVIALKKVRSMIVAGAAGYDEFYQQLRLLEPAFLTSVKDLRSLVVREACVGIAFLSQQFGQKFDHFAESLLPALIGLIPNSAKVISTSGIVAVRFIIAHTHSPRLIPVLTEKMNNKSKEIRKQVCEFLDQLVHAWPVQKMERHVPALQDAIKKGIGDAEQDARASARRAYYGFADHFKDQAANLLNSLDPQYKKALHCDQAQPMSNSSSHSSLNNVGRTPLVKSKASSSTSTSTENLQKLPLPRRPAVPTGLPNGSGGVPSLSNRSNSAIELQAVQRSKLRAQQYATAQRMKIGSGASLPRPMKKPSDPSLAIGASPLQSPDHTRRPRGNGISQSQPSSRSGSPSSRLSYATYTSQTPTSASRRPGTVRNPKSSLTSRETSPSRGGNSRMSKLRTRSIGTDRGATPQAYGTARPVMAQKILQQSREAESALADALATTPVKRCGYDDHSDESETSSLCSDRSFDSYHRRASDARSHRTDYSEYKDVGEIINQCASTHWNERKDGLLALQPYFQSGNTLTIPELKRLTEIFTRMFTDAHTKVFGIFLDALAEFIIAHKSELADWLYVLLTRLFNKLGADLLGSIQTKIYKTLDLVRESFAYEQQFSLLIRFLTDATQTPNTRVKVAVLNYLHALCTVMDPGGVSALLSAPSSMPLSPGLHGHTGTKAMETAIMKLVSWTGDPKSMDVRRASEETLVALFNLNPGEITKVLNNLPKNYQDSVQKILQSRVNRSLDVGDLSRGSTPLSTPLRSPPVSLLSSTPATPMSLPATPLGHPRPRPGRSFDDDLNPEEIQRSIRKTTEEIQNYGFNSLEGRRDSAEKLKRELSDEGIISSGSPRSRQSGNGLEKSMAAMHLDEGLLEPDSDEPFDEKAVFVQVIAGLQGQKPSSCDDRRDAIKKLIRLLSRGHGALVAEHFKAVLRLLLDSLNDPSSSVRKTVYIALSDLLATPELSSNCTTFAELLILRILSGHKDAEKEVVRAAEMCAGTLVQHLPFDSVVRVLRPIIQNGEFPENQAAIKTLTRAIERQSKETLINILPEIMPGLVQAYDSPESIVRKAAVFSMVALHLAVGEGIMQRYYESLNSSKLKLLNLYIKRAESQSASASQSHTPTMAESPKPQ